MKNEKTHSRFAVPVAVAVAVHAFLFFGFTKSPTVKPPPKPPVDRGPVEVVHQPPPEPPEPAENSPDSPPDVKAGPILPGLPDLPTVSPDPTSIPMDPQPRPIGPVTGDLHSIPATGPGLDGTAPVSEIITSKLLDREPAAKVRVPPEYPYSMRTSGITGEVWVEFVVDERGNVMNARILKSTHSEFEAPTLRAVSKWRFESGKRNNRAVKFRMTVPVVFSMSE